MSGCYGSHPEDRHYERLLDEHTNRETDEDYSMNTQGIELNIKYREVITYLRLISDIKNVDKVKRIDWGICNALYLELGIRIIYDPVIQNIIISWNKYTDSAKYPVPHVELYPDEAFELDNLWADNQYGNDRRELCAHIADGLEQLLDRVDADDD